MRKCLFTAFVFIFPFLVFCQDELTRPVSIRVSLFGPMDVLDGNITGGVEYGLGPRISLTADVGGYFYSVYMSNNRRALGYIFKPGFRYYFTDRRRGYISGDLFYKRVGYKIIDWLEKDVSGGVAAYEQHQAFIYQKKVAGFQFLSGYKARINKPGTVWLEPYGGFSVRVKWEDIKGEPNSRYGRNNFFANGLREDYNIFPGVQVGLRLVIDLPATAQK